NARLKSLYRPSLPTILSMAMVCIPRYVSDSGRRRERTSPRESISSCRAFSSERMRVIVCVDDGRGTVSRFARGIPVVQVHMAVHEVAGFEGPHEPEENPESRVTG